MSLSLLDEARNHLVRSLTGKRNRRETRHPWRKGWEFVVQHSLPVEVFSSIEILALTHRSLESFGVSFVEAGQPSIC